MIARYAIKDRNFSQYAWLLIFFAFILFIEKAYAEPRVGRVLAVTGSVVADAKDGQRTLRRGNAIYLKEIIKTGDNAKVHLRFNDGTLLNLAPKSELVVRNYLYSTASPENSNMTMDLLKGGFRGLTGQINKKNDKAMKINTPVAVVGVRGTTFELMISGDCNSASSNCQLYLSVIQGLLNVGSMNFGPNGIAEYGVITKTVVTPLNERPKILNKIGNVAPSGNIEATDTNTTSEAATDTGENATDGSAADSTATDTDSDSGSQTSAIDEAIEQEIISDSGLEVSQPSGSQQVINSIMSDTTIYAHANVTDNDSFAPGGAVPDFSFTGISTGATSRTDPTIQTKINDDVFVNTFDGILNRGGATVANVTAIAGGTFPSASEADIQWGAWDTSAALPGTSTHFTPNNAAFINVGGAGNGRDLFFITSPATPLAVMATKGSSTHSLIAFAGADAIGNQVNTMTMNMNLQINSSGTLAINSGNLSATDASGATWALNNFTGTVNGAGINFAINPNNTSVTGTPAAAGDGRIDAILTGNFTGAQGQYIVGGFNFSNIDGVTNYALGGVFVTKEN